MKLSGEGIAWGIKLAHSLQSLNLKISEKLRRDVEYRRHYFRAQTADSIAIQIRELRKRRHDMSQTQLADSCGMKQSAVSRIEQADYSSWSLKTLWRVAEALESRLIVTFQPTEEAIGSQEITEKAPRQTGYLAAGSLQVHSSYQTGAALRTPGPETFRDGTASVDALAA